MKYTPIFAVHFINAEQTLHYARQMQTHQDTAKSQNTSTGVHKVQEHRRNEEQQRSNHANSAQNQLISFRSIAWNTPCDSNI